MDRRDTSAHSYEPRELRSIVISGTDRGMAGLERDLVDFVEAQPDLIETGMTVIGRESGIGGLRADLLLRDKFGAPVIVEFKRGTLKPDAIGQVAHYVGMVSDAHPNVRAFLIAERIPPAVKKALDHYGIEYREIPMSDEGSVRIPSKFDVTVAPIQPVARSSTAGHALPMPILVRDVPRQAYLVPANSAYSIYRKSGIYCCPVTMRNLSGTIPDLIAFYDHGVKREMAQIRGIVDIPVNGVEDKRAEIENAGRDVQRIGEALRAWSAWGTGRDGNHSYDIARVALLSAPNDDDTVLLDREIPGAVGAGKGHQSSSAFAVEDLMSARTFDELREKQRKRRR